MIDTNCPQFAPRRDALRFASIYFLAVACWILATDSLLTWMPAPFNRSIEMMLLRQAVYLLLSSATVFWLVARFLRQRNATILKLAESHDHFQKKSQQHSTLLAASPTVLYAFRISNAETSAVQVSDNIERITGYTAAEALAAGWWPEHIHPEDRAQAIDGHRALTTHSDTKLEYRFVRKDGGVVWLLDVQRVLESNTPDVIEIVGSWTDITDRKLAELASRESMAILHAALDQSPSGVIIADAPSGKLRYANAAAMRNSAAEANQSAAGDNLAACDPVWHLLDLNELPLNSEDVPLTRALAHGERNTREIIIRRGKNDDRVVIASAAPIKNEVDAVIAAVVVFVDVTALRKAAVSLLKTNERIIRQRNALALLTGTNVLVRDDLVAVLRRISETTANTLGASRVSIWRYDKARTQLVCFELYELEENNHTTAAALPIADYPNYHAALANEDVIAANDAQQDLRTAEFTKDYLLPLGITSVMDAAIYLGGEPEGVICVEHIGPPRTWESDEQTFAVAVANTVSLAMEVGERCQAETMLQSAQERLQRAVSAGNVGLWDWDLSTNELFYTTQANLQLGEAENAPRFGYDEWVARIHPEDVARAQAYASAYIANPDHPYLLELRLRHTDGSYRWILAQGSLESDPAGQPARILGSHVDITARKQLESEFHQAQKMESVGRLAGGVAHDFNNLLTVISGYSEMALNSLQEGEPLYRDLMQVRRAADRAADLTRQLLAFSRRQVLRPKLIGLNDIVADAETMLRRLIGEDIEFVFAPGEDLGSVVADPGQMEQVIMNLVINARDAMPMGGRIAIDTSNIYFDDSVTTRHLHLAPGPYVCIAISDTGSGMDKATQERIFEPFFSTKAPDKGTGLGLATVYGIVKQSGGSILVYSEVAHGTTFKVYLPRIESNSPEESPTPVPERVTPGTETVLLVEDEDALRQLAERILVVAGYKVLAAANGADTLALLATSDMPIDLLLTDVIMPGISGRDLANELSIRYPTLKVLYMSGYTDTAIAVHGVLDQGTQLLNKPFTAVQLTQKIREVLNAPIPAAA